MTKLRASTSLTHDGDVLYLRSLHNVLTVSDPVLMKALRRLEESDTPIRIDSVNRDGRGNGDNLHRLVLFLQRHRFLQEEESSAWDAVLVGVPNDLLAIAEQLSSQPITDANRWLESRWLLEGTTRGLATVDIGLRELGVAPCLSESGDRIALPALPTDAKSPWTEHCLAILYRRGERNSQPMPSLPSGAAAKHIACLISTSRFALAYAPPEHSPSLGCLNCFLRWNSENTDQQDVDSITTIEQLRFSSRVFANALFESAVVAPLQDFGSVHRVDFASLTTVVEPAPIYLDCARCHTVIPVGDDQQSCAEDDALLASTLLECAYKTLVHPAVGVVRSLTEGALVQIPVLQSAVTWSWDACHGEPTVRSAPGGNIVLARAAALELALSAHLREYFTRQVGPHATGLQRQIIESLSSGHGAIIASVRRSKLFETCICEAFARYSVDQPNQEWCSITPPADSHPKLRLLLDYISDLKLTADLHLEAHQSHGAGPLNAVRVSFKGAPLCVVASVSQTAAWVRAAEEIVIRYQNGGIDDGHLAYIAAWTGRMNHLAPRNPFHAGDDMAFSITEFRWANLARIPLYFAAGHFGNEWRGGPSEEHQVDREKNAPVDLFSTACMGAARTGELHDRRCS